MSTVAINGLNKKFGSIDVLNNIDIDIDDGEFIVLVGPSGCGKTTLLRMIAGLESVTTGSIFIGNRDMTWLQPAQRDIAMVFQSYALYPHMTVFDNMGFGLKIRKTKPPEIKKRVNTVANNIGIGQLLNRKPDQLSGGQQQRVAMGRAIVRDPSVYLFDEPLSNLDAQLRTDMRTEIKRMHLEQQQTSIYVTHDQIEALTLADRIIVMNKGEIQQIGTPDTLYNNPKSIFVASFIGSPAMSFLTARLVDNGGITAQVGTPDKYTSVPVPELRNSEKPLNNTNIVVGIRPEAFHYNGSMNGLDLSINVEVVEPCGSETYVIGDVDGQKITARCDPRNTPKTGEYAHFVVDPLDVHVFDENTGISLKY